MSSTRYFGIGFFDFGTQLGTDFTGQVEIDRFVFIDKQLFGLMSIFGNGVVDGWVVAAEEAFRLNISEGFGNINFTSGKTTFPVTLSNIPANSTVYIYAKTRARTTFTEEIEFIFDLSATLAENNLNFLILAKVTTGNLSIESVDNTFRQEIAFIELINAAIRLHKHRGGSLNPSKIDLANEVKGQLPSFRIADFDAEKINTGTLDLYRMPLFDHQDLANVGLLTHPQLDTFVKTLEANNTELFGEIGTSNMLQLIIFAKLVYEDPDSAFFTGTQPDENMTNEFVVIPGITTNDRIDFDNSTAEINLIEHFIKGIPPTSGTSFFVNYDTALAWNAQTLSDLIVVADTVAMAFDPSNTTTTTVVEGFESATASNQNLTDDDGTGLFEEQTVVIVNEATIESNSNSTNVTEGFFSGKFKHQQSFRVQFVKNFSTAQDWTNFDQFSLNVKCNSDNHGPVNLFFVGSDYNFENGTGTVSPDFSILAQNESTNNFEVREIDLTTITFIDNIKAIVIYSDDHTTDFTYFIDNMVIQKAILLPEEGTMNLVYSAGSQVTFSTLTWTSTEPSGTEIEVRARAATGSVLLKRSVFTDFLNSGDNLNLIGTDLEVEFTFLPNTDRTSGPILLTARLLILTEAEIDGFVIDTSEEFNRGSSENISIGSDVAQLDTPIYVDSVYFASQNRVNQGQINATTSAFTSELGILGTKDSPVSPNQVFKAVEDNVSGVSNGLFHPKSVRRQVDRSFVIADTFSDRILRFDETGTLVTGVGSINYKTDTLFPIASCVDIRTSILYVVWSQIVDFNTVNVSKFTVQTSTQTVQLIKDFDKILGKTTSNVNGVGQIMPIHLSAQNAGLVQNLPKTDTFLQTDGSTEDGVVPGGIDKTSDFYSAAAAGLGIPCYVGNFAYVDGIFSPTFVDITEAGNWLLCNGTIGVKNYDIPNTSTATVNKISNVSDIVEIDTNNNVTFGINVMKFSPFIPGRVLEIDSSTLLIGGIRPGGGDVVGDGADPPIDFRNIGGTEGELAAQKVQLNNLFFVNGSSSSDSGEPKTNPHVGAVIIYDRSINTTTFSYISASGILVSDVDRDSLGQYVVAESSLDRAGRIIKLDTSGNVVFSFGEGLYSIINDCAVQFDDSMVIST